MIDVIIADDQQMVRSGLRSLLQEDPEITVVAEVADGAAAVEAVRALQPDVVLMDIRMPVLDGLSATRELARRGDAARILVLTTFDLDEYVFDALHAGASGFLLKDSTAEDLVNAVKVLSAGNALLDPVVTGRVIDAFVTAPRRPAASNVAARLTDRERQVLELLARGLSNAEIARRLHITAATTKTHVSNILSKLRLRDRVQAVIWAYEHGLIPPPTPGN
jgi:DNA-binding NarL/FixJ family response regulator